jgi:hypothetical protein
LNIPALEFLLQYCGDYSGEGTNPEGLGFKATLSIQSKVHDNLIELKFRAEDSGSAFHEEATWITTDLLTDRLSLWTVSSNTPGVLKHDLFEDAVASDRIERRFAFQLGKPDDMRIFRQVITLEIRKDGFIEYRYAWAVPHEALAPRTRSVLRKT